MVKRSIPHKVFATKEDFHRFVKNEKAWMYSRIVEAIEEAFHDSEMKACIFEAKIEEAGTIITMNSETEDWEKSLSLAMKWNEKQENYEECIRIQKLINEIKDCIG